MGDLTFPILCDFAEHKVFTITDDQMIEGMKLAFERLKVNTSFFIFCIHVYKI